jgi:hypothetical protein
MQRDDLRGEIYTLIPARIRKWDLITQGLQRFSLFLLLGSSWSRRSRRGSRLRGWSCRRSGRRGGLLGVERTDLELGFVFLEDTFIVVFPELLAGVLAGYAGEDLLAAWQT